MEEVDILQELNDGLKKLREGKARMGVYPREIISPEEFKKRYPTNND